MQLLPCNCEKFTAVRSDRYASAAGDWGAEMETTSARDDRLAGITPMTGTLFPAGREEVLAAADLVVEELQEEGHHNPEQ